MSRRFSSKHPALTDIALLAGNDLAWFSRLRVSRHVNGCDDCQEHLAAFSSLRADVADVPEPALDWSAISADMRANIRLGLEAGECVRKIHSVRRVAPRLAVAMASLVVLLGAGFILHNSHVPPVSQPVARNQSAAPRLEMNRAGIEVRAGGNSLTLLNHRGAVAAQTVGSQGEIRARYIDGETGSVTINNVYLE